MGSPYRLFEPTGLVGEIKGGKPGKCIALRADIDAHHHGAASRVSNGLMEAEALAAIFARHLRVTDVISTDEMYQVVGEKE